MKKLNKMVLGLTALVMGFGGSAIAAEQTASVQVNASISPTCSVILPTIFSRSYNPSTDEVTTDAVVIKCTKTTPYELGVSTGFGASENSRFMQNTTESSKLAYTLEYKLGATSKVWGDIGSVSSINGFGLGVDEIIEVNLNVPKGQYVEYGSYSDELVITLNY